MAKIKQELFFAWGDDNIDVLQKKMKELKDYGWHIDQIGPCSLMTTGAGSGETNFRVFFFLCSQERE